MKSSSLLAFVLLSAFYSVAGAGSLEEKRLIKQARADWHARTGETMDEIVNKVSKVAHFIPTRWSSSIEQKEKYVSLFWKKMTSNSADEEMSVDFVKDASGKFFLKGGYSEFNLGSSAFSISLIQQDLNDEVPSTDTSFNFSNKNYGFIHMPHGNLAQALDTSHCHLKSPAYVYYISDAVNDSTKDTFYVSLTADCAVPGDTLFTHDGYIQFRSPRNSSEWEPVSYLAKRFWQGRALTDAPDGEEQTIGVVRKATSEDANDIIRFIEMRRYKMDMLSDEISVRSNIKLVQKICSANPRASAHELTAFLRGAGGMAHTLSDEGIEHMSSLF